MKGRATAYNVVLCEKNVLTGNIKKGKIKNNWACPATNATRVVNNILKDYNYIVHKQI